MKSFLPLAKEEERQRRWRRKNGEKKKKEKKKRKKKKVKKKKKKKKKEIEIIYDMCVKVSGIRIIVNNKKIWKKYYLK